MTTSKASAMDSPAAISSSEDECVQVLDSIEPLVPSVSQCLGTAIVQEPVDSAVALAIVSSEPLPPDTSASQDEAGPSTLGGSSHRRKHLTSEEVRQRWNMKKLIQTLGTNEFCMEFAERRGLIPTQRMCPVHRKPMTLRKIGQLGMFRCRKSNCRSKDVCRSKGTWFENVRLQLKTVFMLMYCFSNSSTYEETQNECSDEDGTAVSHKTISDWYSYCRETILVYVLEHSEEQNKIGGPGCIVQIDESKFGKRKYNRGRILEGHWVIGMIADGSDDLRLEVCPDNERSAQVLVPLIQKHVEEGSIIHTDFWRVYDCLGDYGYTHKKVNHSDPEHRFVAPDGTHTQRIESHWRALKTTFRKDSYKENFTDWLAEYNWRRNIKIKHLDPFEELIKCIQYVYT